MEIVYLVTDADHGLRAVDVLVTRTGMSRLMSKRIRLYGELLNNGRPWRMIDPVERGDQLVARTAGHSGQPSLLRHPAGIDFVYQDDWLVILNKPAGIVVHPTYRHETGTLTDLLSEQPLHPVSRLDRDTSGLVMIARNGHAHYVVMQQPMKKTYLALVHGRMPERQGLIDAPISRDPDSIIKRRVDPSGSVARTLYREVHYFPAAAVSSVEFELLTGRTHQIRVHSQFVGNPLVGETLYGHSAEDQTDLDRQLGRQALHARSLGFIHPQTKEPVLVHAPLPSDLRQILHQLS